MKHLRGFESYNEGIFDPIRRVRFKDDEIVQNLIKIINRTNKKDINVNAHREGDGLSYSVSIPSENIEFNITYKEKFNWGPSGKGSTDKSISLDIDGITLSCDDSLPFGIRSGDISLANGRKLWELVSGIQHKSDDEDIKSTLKKELKYKVGKK